MKEENIFNAFISDGNAEYTNRLIPGDEDFDYPEWSEYGTLDGVPVVIYYRTTPEDQELVNDNGGDFGAIAWTDRVDRVTLDLVGCDKNEIDEEKMKKVCKEYEIDWE